MQDGGERKTRKLYIHGSKVRLWALTLNTAVALVLLVVEFIAAYRAPPSNPYGHYLAIWILLIAVVLTVLSLPEWPLRLTVSFVAFVSLGGALVIVAHAVAGYWIAFATVSWVIPLAVTYTSCKHRPSTYESLDGQGHTQPHRCQCCLGVLVHSTRVLVALLVVLLAYQAILHATASQYTAPGVLVSIAPDNHNVHLYCKGQANSSVPTFLLHHGGGSASPSLYGLQDELVLRGRKACVVDRSGFGYSDFPGVWPRNSTLDVEEIADALKGARLSEDLIVLGHSAGGQIALRQASEASTYTQVTGVGLLDSVPSDYLRTFERYANPDFWTEERINATYATQARMLDVYRAIWPLGILSMFAGKGPFVPADKASENRATYIKEKTWVMQYHMLKTDSIDLYETFPTQLPGNPDMLVVRALATCEDQGLHGDDCDYARTMYERGIEVAYEQAEMVTPPGSVVICPYPCSHGFVYENPAYVADLVMDAFANTTARA